MRGLFRFLRELCGETGGAVSILAALVLVSVIGVSALALEYGHGLLQKVENQRVADLAAYGGALVYGATSSSTSATGAAANVAALNGVSSGVVPSVVSSPTGDGNSAVRVTVTKNVPLVLARVLTTSATMPVTATAYAEIKSDAPACVIALSGSGTGVTMSGGTNLTADSCAVASNNSFALSGGAKLVTQNVDYGKTAPSVSGGASITAPSGKTLHQNKVTTTDPLAPSSGSPGSTEVSNATAHLGFNSTGGCAGTSGTVCAITSPAAPTVPAGTAVNFGYNSIPTSNLPANCSDSWNSSAHTHTLTCTGTGPFDFGAISLAGGLSATVTNTSSGATYNFSGAVNASSSNGLTFNGGSGAAYNMAGGLITGGNAPMSFSAGTFNIAASSASCNSSSGYSICDSSTLSIAGPSTFVLTGGIYISGGSNLTLGTTGTNTNSYHIGAASDGYSIAAGGGAATTFYDATGTGDLFQTAGNILNGGSSSACLTLPAAAEHDINGYVSLSCGATLGAGVYTVAKYVSIGGSGGGGTVTGSNVTIVVGGFAVPTSGSCQGLAFCIANGFSNVTLTAPTSGGTKNLAVIGPLSSSKNPSAGATFVEGSSGTNISGAFYFPNGGVSLSGSATINSSGGCLELIGSQVTLGGGSAAGSTCSGLTSNSLGTVVTLVQ